MAEFSHDEALALLTKNFEVGVLLCVSQPPYCSTVGRVDGADVDEGSRVSERPDHDVGGQHRPPSQLQRAVEARGEAP